jgi:hypothetical protein
MSISAKQANQSGYVAHELASQRGAVKPLDGLVEDIKLNGLREPIVLYQGKILDGRRRQKAGKKAGVPLRTRNFGDRPEDGSDPQIWLTVVHSQQRVAEKPRVVEPVPETKALATITSTDATLASDLDAFLQAKAENIGSLLRRSKEDIVTIGLDLIEVRERLEHGQFLAWIQAEFEMSQANAYNFIHVAEKFSGKLTTVVNLPTRVIYELAAPGTSDEIIKRVEAGEVKPTLEAIRRAKRAEKAAKSDVIEAEAVVVEPTIEQETQDPVEIAKVDLAEIEAELVAIKARLEAWWEKGVKALHLKKDVTSPGGKLLHEERSRVSSLVTSMYSLL